MLLYIVVIIFFLEMKLNQEYWVSELPEPLTYIPIIELAIPGIFKLLIIV